MRKRTEPRVQQQPKHQRWEPGDCSREVRRSWAWEQCMVPRREVWSKVLGRLPSLKEFFQLFR